MEASDTLPLKNYIFSYGNWKGTRMAAKKGSWNLEEGSLKS